jgi:CBS domain containing-hemolysin-like protein
MLLWLLLAFAATCASAMWSGIETATYVVSRFGVERRLNEPRLALSARRLKRELDHPERTLAALLVANNVSNYLGALAISAMLSAASLPAWAVTVINIAILTPILFVFAETLPKELFRTRAEVLAYRFAPVLAAVRTLLTVVGVIPLLLGVTGLCRWMLGSRRTRIDPGARVSALLQEAEGSGLLSRQQIDMLDRAAAFSEITAADEMTPWSRVVSLRAGMSVRAARVAALRFDRFPVIDARGRLAGVVRAADILMHADTSESIDALLSQPARLAPGATLAEAITQLRASGQAMAVVESDRVPLGIVTLSDLADPLTGRAGAW